MQEINATKRTDIYQIDPRNVDVVAGFNVRREFAIDELKEQIKLNGVLNPITVIPTKAADGTERYRLVDGERRLRATLAAIEEGADIRRIKAIFLPRNTSEEEQLVQQMMRNEGKNFTEYECAIMFHRFKEAFGYSQTEIAAKFGKSPTFVSRCLNLMELAPEIQQKLVDTLQQQAELMRKLAEIQEQASQEIEKIQCFCNAEREWRHEIKQWAKLGWGYKPKLHTAANKPHRAKPYWYRTRSFCVRRGYH